MKNIVISAVLTSVLAVPALADSKVKASVQDHYRTVTHQIPYTERQCSIVDVPIYGRTNGGASGGDVLGGMIIGGLLGKGITGQDNGAAAGAIFGGIIAADKKQGKEVIIGYRQEEQCSKVTRYNTQTEDKYTHSTVTFYENGRQYTITFQK
tara:strand:- start:461 stop:916 length:456 start_codon:yes stop_codon:yes gene_type:complete